MNLEKKSFLGHGIYSAIYEVHFKIPKESMAKASAQVEGILQYPRYMAIIGGRIRCSGFIVEFSTQFILIL